MSESQAKDAAWASVSPDATDPKCPARPPEAGTPLESENLDERIHDARVELGARAAPELGRRRLARECIPVGAVGGHGVPRVASAHDARDERDRLAC